MSATTWIIIGGILMIVGIAVFALTQIVINGRLKDITNSREYR